MRPCARKKKPPRPPPQKNRRPPLAHQPEHKDTSELSAKGEGGHKPSEPERRCIVTGERADKDALLRFACDPAGQVVPDFSGKAPGRGAWVVCDRSRVDEAVKRGAFARAFKRPVDAAPDLGARVDQGLEQTALDSLGLARRIGDVVCGFEKTKAAFASGRGAVFLVASDASPDSRSKLRAVVGDAPTIELFDASALSGALGRDVVFAAIQAGHGAARALATSQRLATYREGRKGTANS